jgi:predicted nucleotidyltransferase
MHLTFIPLRSIKADDFSVSTSIVSDTMLPEEIRDEIIACLRKHNVLLELWPELAVYVSGSFGAGVADEYSDLDVYVLYPESYHQSIVDDFLQRDIAEEVEFFIVRLPISRSAHFSLQTFESARNNIVQLECISMYRYAHSTTLHDPTRKFAKIREESQRLPKEMIRTLLQSEYAGFIYHASPEATSNLLRRKDRATLCLRTWKGLEYALRICCILDRLPYPHEKRIVEVGLQTTLGKELKDLFENFFKLLETNAFQQNPSSTEKPAIPKHEGLQYYKYYCFQRELNLILRSRLEEAGVSRRKLEWISELAEL